MTTRKYLDIFLGYDMYIFIAIDNFYDIFYSVCFADCFDGLPIKINY